MSSLTDFVSFMETRKTDSFQDEVLAKIEIYYCLDTSEKAYDEKSQVHTFRF